MRQEVIFLMLQDVSRSILTIGRGFTAANEFLLCDSISSGIVEGSAPVTSYEAVQP